MLNYSSAGVARFGRAARQHHEVAVGVLSSCGKGTKESIHAYHAIYIGGYAVECALKAIYLDNALETSHGQLIDERFKLLGHNLLGCYDTVRQQFGKHMPPPLLRRFRRVVQMWNVQMRYWAGKRRVADATLFLQTSADVLTWAGVK